VAGEEQRLVGRSLRARIEYLEAKLIEPPLPVCGTCGTVGGRAVVNEVHHVDGSVTYNSRLQPPCPECERISASMGHITRIVICEFYACGPEGASCPVCGQESLATIRRKLADGEMTTSEVPRMVEVSRRRINREEARAK
jgi:hypothetical protein